MGGGEVIFEQSERRKEQCKIKVSTAYEQSKFKVRAEYEIVGADLNKIRAY